MQSEKNSTIGMAEKKESDLFQDRFKCFHNGIILIVIVNEPAYSFSLYIFTQSTSILTGYSFGSALPTHVPSICMSISR